VTYLRIVRTLVVASSICAVAWGCHDAHHRVVNPIGPSATIVGSGVLASESRPVSPFTTVSVSVPARVVIVQSGTERLSITAEDNILPLVRTDVVGGRLVLALAPAPSLNITRGIVIEISARALSAIDATGATSVELTGLEADVFSLQISGASEVMASGTVRQLELHESGAVRCLLERLVARSAVSDVSGTSYARLRIADSLNATASGVSAVEYYGDPVVVANVSGTSVVRRLGP